MPDALNELNAMIERVRAEADATGYARAWREVAKLAASRSGAADAEETASGAAAALVELSALPSRAPRGENRRRVAEALAISNKPRAAQEVRRHIEREDGVELAYSSVQQALLQLENAGEAIKDADGKWSRVNAPWLLHSAEEGLEPL